MTTESRSALRVNYDLRPAKQVERRMIVDALQRLAQAGFQIRDYQYTGFGALQFVDFLLFHKLLGIDSMLSIEHDLALEDRVMFNCPLGCIDVRMQSASEIIPTLSRDRLHMLWLDYDDPVTGEVLADVFEAGTQLTIGSILLITVDAEPPVKGKKEPQESRQYFEGECGSYLGLVDTEDFTPSRLPRTSVNVIMNALQAGMIGRPEIEFYPLFHFVYADGHRMLTVGGVIGTKTEKHRMDGMNKEGATYLRTSLDSAAYEIRVYPFTRKERHLLDAAMPCPAGWQPDEFKLPEERIEAYREIYRFYPVYAELLL